MESAISVASAALRSQWGVLLGDTTANRVVNASDVNQVKSQTSSAVSAFNFRTDVTVNGAINASDVSLTQAQSSHGL
jgi:hypothetical protein